MRAIGSFFALCQSCLNSKSPIRSLFKKFRFPTQAKSNTSIKGLTCSFRKGLSIVELLVVISIMLLITGGTIKLLLPYSMQTQNLIHSQISEGNFRNLMSELRDSTACTKTFSGKNIGQSISQIKDKDGISIFDKSVNDIFQRNLKIINIKTVPKKTLCSSVRVVV